MTKRFKYTSAYSDGEEIVIYLQHKTIDNAEEEASRLRYANFGQLFKDKDGYVNKRKLVKWKVEEDKND